MKGSRRALIVRSGMELFSRHGYRDVAVADIVGDCGLSVGTFYRYFSGKESFYEHILAIIEQEGIRKVEVVIGRLHSPLNKLKALYQFVVLGMRRYPILRGVLRREERFMYPGLDLQGGAVGNLRIRIEKMVREIIRDGSRRGVFRPGLYHDANRLVMVLLDTVIFNFDDPRVEMLAQDVLVLIQRGLRRRLRLRRRDERRDRRLIDEENPIEWIET
ncbi:MAG: TetR/AcrR family transcriptional regulator [Spirochaetaceae bacterium]|nr:MAG: TetR/AcrR family transcriptional regulator [Spirochaetaceae bacterium]